MSKHSLPINTCGEHDDYLGELVNEIEHVYKELLIMKAMGAAVFFGCHSEMLILALM